MKRTHYTNELEKNVGKEVIVSGWVHDVRLLGKINFILLRDREGIAQVTILQDKVSKNIMELVKKLHQEDVLTIKGKIQKSKSKDYPVELIPDKIELVNKSEVPLPMDPREVTKANMDTRIDWRVLDFRTPESKAIFKIQNEIIRAFREFFIQRKYIEMQPPIIIGSASEGGAELFQIPYFEKKAYLAQSPQLYKQMGAISFEKVFAIMPIFRAEKFDTPTHLNEIRQMDIEQAFIDDEEAMDILEECFLYVLSEVKKNRKEELKILDVKLEIPKSPLKRVTYEEAIKILQKNGEKINFGDDFTKGQENKMGKLIGDAFFIKHWPTEIKAFYAMPDEENPKICHAYDLIYNGLEICSGTQRIHIPELLAKQIKSKGLDPKDFKFYIDAFRYGAPHHSGWSIGLERFTMQITGKTNIREVTMFPRDRNRITP
jgi:nondiscriminating aspartyl-tRNA synthetase